MKFRIFNRWLVATSSSAGHYSLSLFCPNVSDFPCQSCSWCLSLGPCCLMADWNSFQPSGRGAGDMWRLGRKWSLTRLLLARLPFSLPFSQAEEAQETCEGMEGKEVPRVSFSRVSVSVTFLSSGRGAGDARRHGRKRTSSRVFCFHYLLAKQETTATPARLIVLCPCFFVLFSLKGVIVS